MTRRKTDTQVPKILYKYRDWNNNYQKRIITHQEIFLANPTYFNDPFENIPIQWDKVSYEDCIKENMIIAKLVNPNSSKEELLALSKEITKQKLFWHPDKLKRENKSQIEDWNNKLGFYCLSETNDNLLMWSHYSKNHEGFMVGFYSESLLNDYNDEFDYLEKVIYCKDYPKILGLNTNEDFYKKFFHKSIHWNYENEWRISKNHIENRLIKLKKNTIAEIVIGCKTPNEHKEEIISISRDIYGKEVDIYIAEKDSEKFKLNIKKI
ncbi:DUF2971 domain-containing protein [Elizabethkingia meningoseptica]|uniref:DUF2971 domain-containing protein n=1 Tax=Elizabethkingia meningoseptica TaxID=238 RepID=UPI0023B03E89|nr:DUF2971 domain-containing protein [Elizabethkingia meningoseptica]MDE5487376.1 DUF2971 domain-containing protein [Elizabethkingia meningoseptica]